MTRFDPFPAYAAHLHTLVDFERLAAGKLTVAVDAMYGAGRLHLRRLLAEAGYISDVMLLDDVLLGGEESGGITIRGHIPEGDGILMGLLLAEVVAARGKSLQTLLTELMAMPDVGVFCYARADRPVRPFKKADLVRSLMVAAPTDLAGVGVAQISDRDGVKYILADNSWLLIRPSGTEPVLRIYAESHSDAQVQRLLEAGALMAEAQLAGELER